MNTNQETSKNFTNEVLSLTTLRVYRDGERLIIVDSEKFGTINECDAYDEYGQRYDCEMCECHSHNNPCYKSELEGIVRACIANYDDLDDEEKDELLKKEYEEQYGEEEHTTIQGITEWNGHNWVTIKLAGLSELDDDTQARILNEYLNGKTLIDKGFGTETSESEHYRFIESVCEGHYEQAIVEEL